MTPPFHGGAGADWLNLFSLTGITPSLLPDCCKEEGAPVQGVHSPLLSWVQLGGGCPEGVGVEGNSPVAGTRLAPVHLAL